MSATGHRGLAVAEATVLPEWIDYNGHMNVAAYRAVFDRGTDGLFELIGLGPAYLAERNATVMVVEEHTRYHAEVVAGQRVRVLARLVGSSAKKLHYALLMENVSTGALAATHEELVVHVDLAVRRSSPLPAEVRAAFERLLVAQAALPPAPDLGRVIAL